MPMFSLKTLHPDAVGTAQKKAVRYRLLNEPRLAESICRDILAVDPSNQNTIITLILALSDQYVFGNISVKEPMELVSQLDSEFLRHYYTGIICERRGVAALRMGGAGSGHIAFDWLRRAMDHYDDAEEVSPPGNDDAILRWNTCARTINNRPEVRPAPDEGPAQMLE
jgi:hypothetical protein